MDLLRQILQQFANVFKGMTASQRMSMAMLVLTVVVSLILLVVWGGATQYTALFRGLPTDQANQVMSELERMGEDYRYRAGNIEVRGDRWEVILARLTEAQALPEVDDPFAWVYEDKLAETKGRRDLKYITALQSKLQQMINYLEPVRSSAVVITRAEETPFVLEREEKAKASVVVWLAPGVNMLPGGVVRSICRLVAGSFKGLTPENVSVVDHNGILYRLPSEEEGILLAGDQLEMKKRVEAEYVRKVEEILEFLNRPGSLAVTAVVDVTLDFDQIEKETRDVDPDSVVTVHEVTRDLTKETEGEEGAPPGVGANVQMEIGKTAGGGTSSHTEEEREVTREFSQTVSRIRQIPGGIKDVSVAVVIPSVVDEGGSASGSAPGEEEIESYRQLVMKATNIVDPGKVRVSVVPGRIAAMPTPTPVPLKARIFAALGRQASEWARYAGLLILILIAILMLRSILKRGMARAEAAAMPERVAEAAPPEELPEAERIRAETMEIVRESPDRAADLIKRWLME